MKNITRVFVVGFCFLCCGTTVQAETYYACPAGTYSFNSKCTACPVNCYCVGHTAANLGYKVDFCEPGKAYPLYRSTGITEELNVNGSRHVREDDGDNGSGIFACPVNYPKSDNGAKSSEDCYKIDTATGQREYNKKKTLVSCPAGKYLLNYTCTTCPANCYCVGHGVGTNLGYKVNYCTPTATHKLTRTDPNGADASVDDNHDNSGMYSCPTTHPYAELGATSKTQCYKIDTVSGAKEYWKEIITVNPGYYLPANRNQQVACAGEGKYCPGGTYEKQSVDQGRFDCPYKSKPLPDKSGCNLTLTKDQVQYGPLGKQASLQCWTLSDPDDYKNCIFGIKSKD